MTKRTWNNREINSVLQRLGKAYELPPERSAALEARIRRDIIARYGRFDVPMTAPIHTPEPARGGMLIFLRRMRPALAFAVIGVLVVGAAVVMRKMGTAIKPELPSAVVTSVAPVVPGSGAEVSVFTVDAPAASATTSPAAPAPATRRAYRQPAHPLTPSEGVFTQWGSSVFSEEELLKNRRNGKNVFTS